MRHPLKGFSRRALPLLFALVLTVPIAAAATAPASASGHFQSGKASLDITGAYGFWFKSASPVGSDAVIRVAVGNGSFDPEYFDRFYDRVHAINARFVDDEHGVVFLEFAANGKYHGLSYYFGPGDGCGYCLDDEVQSTVRLSQGRLQGHVGSKEKNRSFEVDLDVPVPEKEWGAPLPRDGGEAAKVYLAYQSALATRDVKAARPLLDARLKAFWQQQEKEGKLDGYLDYCWTEKHLEMKKAEVTGGFIRGDRAVLFVKGQSVTAIHGEALMRREDGVWRFSDELLGVE